MSSGKRAATGEALLFVGGREGVGCRRDEWPLLLCTAIGSVLQTVI
jgi:hypothetical protein